MVEALEALKGDNPKVMGFDYYNVIYVSCVGLVLCMGVVYMIVDDDKVRKMVLT